MNSKLTRANFNATAAVMITLVASLSTGCSANFTVKPSTSPISDKAEQPAPITKPQDSKPTPVAAPDATTGTGNATGTIAAPKLVALADDGRLLKLSDLDAPDGYDVNIISDQTFIDTLQYNSNLYNSQPSIDSTVGTMLDDCVKAKYEVKWVANKLSAKLAYNIDTSECEKKKYTDYTFTSFASNVKGYIYLTCEGGDLSSLHGKTLAQTEASPACPQLHKRFEYVSDLKYEGVNGTGSQDIYNLRNIVFSGSKDLGACKITKDKTKETKSDDCIDVTKWVYSTMLFENGSLTVDSKSYDLEKLAYKGIVNDKSSPDNIWHEAGSIDIAKNGWAGTIKYAGSNESPTFEASMDSQQLSGVLVPPATN